MTRLTASRCVFTFVAAACAAATAAAGEWTGRGEAGIVLSSGNTETKAGNAKLTVVYKQDAWTHQAGFAAVYASDDTGTTAQRWEASEQSNFQYDKRNYWYGGVRYENDRFSGFLHQGAASTGVGHKFIDSPDTLLSAQVGVGYKFLETRPTFSPAGVLLEPSENDNAFAFIGNAEYRHSLNASTSVLNKLTIEYTEENTFLQNELSLQVKMTDKLALGVGYAVRHNTEPPAAFEKTDTLVTANIVYEVK